MRKLNLLIVESGFRTHKECIVRALSQYPLVRLFFANGLDAVTDYSWLDRYGERVFSFSYRQPEQLTERILAFQKKRKIKFDGLVTWVETSAHRVNQAQHDLGLPPISLFTDKSIRNKGLTRQRLWAAGADQVPFHILNSMEAVHGLKAQHLSFPRILKPTEMMASLGVHQVNSIQDIEALWPSIARIDFADEDLRSEYGDISSEVILEEKLEGPGYSIECLTFDGETRVLGYNRKITDLFFDLGNTLNPSDLTDDFKEQIDEKMVKIHKALKIQYGITHIELRMVNGEPKILEMNFRLGGDYIPPMLHQGKRLHLGEVIANTYTGYKASFIQKPLLPRKALYLAEQGSCRVLEDKRPSHIGTATFSPYYKKGDIVFVENPIAYSYLGHILTRDESLLLPKEKCPRAQPVLHQDRNRDGRPILVFRAGKQDFKNLCQIEKEAWPESLRAPDREIKRRLSSKSSRFLIAFDFKSQKPVGFIFWVPCTEEELQGRKSWAYFTSPIVLKRTDAKFQYRYIVSISVSPAAPIDTGKILLKACEQLARQDRVREFRYGLRIDQFAKQNKKGVSVENYVESLKRRVLKENGFSMATNAGARLIRIMKDYYSDPASLDYGLLMSHQVQEVKS